MVLPLVAGLASQIAGSAATAPLSPVFDWMNQEIYKLMPVRKTDINALISLRYRERIDLITFYERMARHGFNKDESDRMFLASEFFPGVQDSIRLAVREADRDDIAAKFGTDSDFDKLPLEEFAKAAITKPQLKRFWRAHWVLPGIAEVFEMLHRLHPEQLPFKDKVMETLQVKSGDVETTQETVKTLLKIQDVMPFWRERQIMISYKPISRIDIRRLEDFGLLTEAQLVFRNREIGYSKEDAEFLAKWTLINNEFKDIKALMKQNAITPEESIQALVEAGATPEDAERLVLRTLPKVKKERLATDRLLTRGILTDGFELEITTREEYKESLIGLNYDEDEAEFIVTITELKMDQKKKVDISKEKDLTKADVLRSFKLKLIARDDSLERLISLGFDEDESNELLDQIRVPQKLKEEEAARKAQELADKEAAEKLAEEESA